MTSSPFFVARTTMALLSPDATARALTAALAMNEEIHLLRGW